VTDEATAWVGRRAVAWVIDEAPVPADLAFTLTVIARRCDENGRGSYQSLRTIAEKAGKSEAQAARDIRRLRDLGLLLLGDQSLPGRHGIPAGQRPTVYDLPLSMTGPKPAKSSRNPTGRMKPADPPELSTAPSTDAPPASMHPLHASSPTPCMDAPQTPCMDASRPPASMHPKQDRNKTENKTSISRGAAEREAARYLRQRYGTGLTDSAVALVIQEAHHRAAARGQPVRHLTRYLESWAEGDLADVVAAAMDGYDQHADAGPPPLAAAPGPAGPARARDPAPFQPPLLQAVPDLPDQPDLPDLPGHDPYETGPAAVRAAMTEAKQRKASS
jgi:hypothetical protein